MPGGATIACHVTGTFSSGFRLVRDQKIEPKAAKRSGKDDVRALLENLTGPSRGRITWLSSDQSDISVDEDRALRIASATTDTHSEAARARLSWSGQSYEIEVLSDNDIWVNGRRVGTAQLLHGDVIEFGDDGPISRFRLCRHTFPSHWPVEEILSDAIAYARSSRRPFRSRMSLAISDGVRRILLETSIVFRVTVIAMLIVLSTFVALQYRSDQRIERSIEAEAQRLEAIASALARNPAGGADRKRTGSSARTA